MTPQQRDAILADQKRFKYKVGAKTEPEEQEETIPIREVKFVPFKLNVFEGRLKAEISVKKGLEERSHIGGA